MGLNIKNERVHELAREAARVLGTNQTRAIEEALERLLRDERGDRRSRIDLILADVDVRLSAEDRAAMRADTLHDEAGLPR